MALSEVSVEVMIHWNKPQKTPDGVMTTALGFFGDFELEINQINDASQLAHCTISSVHRRIAVSFEQRNLAMSALQKALSALTVKIACAADTKELINRIYGRSLSVALKKA